jgi:predicted XRE-type DNA-binding protein
MNNKLIRLALFEHNMKQWELAELLEISEAYLTKKLRKDLPIAEQEKIVKLIEEAEK